MRRWTVLVVSHDSEAPRSYSVTERALRVAAGAVMALVLVALIGLGTIIASVTRKDPAAPTMAATGSFISTPPELDSLRRRVGQLRVMLDTVRGQDARLRRELGEPGLDSTTVLQRFLARLPRILRPSQKEASGLAPLDPADTAAATRAAGAAGRSADSLLAHADELAERMRKLAPRDDLRLDTLEILSLRPESLSVAISGTRHVAREGRQLRWSPTRPGALLAGFEGEVAKVTVNGSADCEVELRARGGLSAHIRATGRALVRKGQRVRIDQPLVVVSGLTPDSTLAARYELRRNGVVLDPARTR